MIGFFRKIRKQLADDDKPLKYIRYAVGEIVLVVIGILIALQINNWNEQRIEIRIEKNNLRAVYQDLKRDHANIVRSIERLNEQYVIGLRVLGAFDKMGQVAVDSADLSASIGWDLSEVIPIERNENTWDQLKVQGVRFSLLGVSLKMGLNDFYRDLDQQINRFNQLPKKIRQDLRETSGLCNNATSVRDMEIYGVESYGVSSKELYRCILSNNKIPGLVAAICVSSLVNTELRIELKLSAEKLIKEMEVQYDFLKPEGNF